MPQDPKAARLLNYVNWDLPELQTVKTAADPAAALVAYLASTPRGKHRFEPDRKQEILTFLRKHYRAWRDFDLGPAKSIAGMSIEAARGPRALARIAALGQAWWATGDPEWGRAFERFYTAVPTGDMFNWSEFNGSQGAIEIAAYLLLQDCPGFSTAGRIAFFDHLCTLADNSWDEHTSTWKHLMLGPEGHNWYLHGMHMLPAFGLVFPECKRSAFLLRTGWSVVEEHVRGHYRADGGARETCIGYQAGSLLGLWDQYLIASRNQYPMSATMAETLLNATRFLLRLMTPQGGLPSFGDGGHHAGGLTDLAAVAAAATGDRECKWYAEYARQQGGQGQRDGRGQIPLGAFWSVGLAGAEAYARIRRKDPNQRSVLLGDTGYAVMRSSAQADAAYLAIAAADRGPIVTSHGHNDIFSLEVHADGVRFIGEMGCAPYGVSPGRDYDESTAAHSCLTIAGEEQVPLHGEWRWDGRNSPAVRRWVSNDHLDFFHGVHEGFYHWPERQVLHERKVLFIKSAPTYWVVFDWVQANVDSDYEIYFHGCVPGASGANGAIALATGSSALAIQPPAGDGLIAAAINPPGLQAYINERKLDAAAYPCFVYRRRAGSTCFVWVLTPGVAPEVKRLPASWNGQEVLPQEVTGLAVQFPTHTDYLGLSHLDYDGEIRIGPAAGWGFLIGHRETSGGPAGFSFVHSLADGICGR